MRRSAASAASLVTAVAMLAGCATRQPAMQETAAASPSPATAPIATASPTPAPVSPLDAPAVEYVKLVLATGERDPGYVDAYYGPPEWQEEAKRAALDVAAIHKRASALSDALNLLSRQTNEADARRQRSLRRQTLALIARLQMLEGEKLAFNDESRWLYDAMAPHREEKHYATLVAEVGALLPGDGPVHERVDAFQRRFTIPKERLDTVFRAAIAACRQRTAAHLELPPGESFELEYVTNQPWSAYNWYKGGYKSVIQLNTDLPIFIDRAIDLACHEGYPGHHVYNVMLEHHLVRQRGWVEFSVYALYSPQSLIAEGSANFGIELAFPRAERLAFEKTELFPLAGLDPAEADRYYQVLELKQKLSYAGNEAARRYLDGEIDAATAVDWLTRYGLQSRERAEQRLRFIEKYRAYVINYNLGQDLVKAYVQARAGNDPNRRWAVFGELLQSPRLPSDLVAVAARAGRPGPGR